MAKFIGAIVVDTERCKGCALCADACPKDVIERLCIVRYRMPRRMYHSLQKKIGGLTYGRTRSKIDERQ